MYKKFMHHGVEVTGREDLIGTHRDHCLCYHCDKLNIDDRTKNCKIASLLFQVCVLTEITAPVFYCKEFEVKK